MDTTLTILFYACSVLALAGALVSVLAGAGAWRGLGLLAVALGTAAAVATLSGGFVALVALVCLAASGVVLAGPRPPGGGRTSRPRLWAQLGAALAALLLAVVVFTALRYDFAHGSYPGGSFNSAGVGRLLFGRDPLAVEAVAALLLVGLAGGAAGWWSRR